MKEHIIELKGLTKRYGALTAVDHLDLNIHKSEIYGLLGPNGAGKSTTIRMMLGLTEPSGGTVSVCGIDSTTHPIEVKRRVGYLPDNVGFYDNRTGLENLVFIARLNRTTELEAYKRAKELLSRVGLADVATKKAGAYSRGMRQRLGLADVLIKKPEVIILDEPTLGIDPSGVRDFLQLIVQLSREEGLAVLLSSHHLHQVQQVCDRVGIFVGGKLLANGDIPTLAKQLFTEDAFTVEAGVQFSQSDLDEKSQLQERLQRIEGVSSVVVNGERLYIGCSYDITPAIARTIIETKVNLTHLSKKEYGLDDIYQRYFEGDAVYEKLLNTFNFKDRNTNYSHPFSVLVAKEIADHIRSWRFIVLLLLILLTCLGSLYTSISNISKAIEKANDPDSGFLFLKLFTLSDGSLPPFHVFVGFLGPLLGISLGFDAINSEQNAGTLSRVMAQPIHRDYLLNAKFVGALVVISTLFFALGFLVMGAGIIIIGIPPSPTEFLRIIFFIILSILYVAFWLNLSILLSVRFQQAATSALTAIAVWLFFTVFYQIIINVVAKAMMPAETANPYEIMSYQKFIMGLLRLVPSQLFSDATTTLLMPSIRSLGPLTMEQMYGAIPSPLPLKESLIIVWPQLTGLIAATVLCFALSYYSFMRKEIKSR